MNYLLDTHTLIWYFAGDKRLTKNVQEIISDSNNRIFYSIVSPWELEIKHLKDKSIKANAEQLSFLCEQNFVELLGLNIEHIINLKDVEKLNKNKYHNDPFDKILISQAISSNMILLTHDKKMKNYDSKFIMCY